MVTAVYITFVKTQTLRLKKGELIVRKFLNKVDLKNVSCNIKALSLKKKEKKGGDVYKHV